jgi:hypothetical protein
MQTTIKKLVKKVLPFAFLEPEGEEGIRKMGHRTYVGGMWDEIGALQFNFLRAQGLRPDHYLLDVACGALRLGVKVIPYLEPGHYLGIEKEAGLVKAGLEKELDPAVRLAKQPHLVVSDSFEFEKLGQKADFAIAQSLFSHFPGHLIETCLTRLYPHMRDGGTMYATFFESKQRVSNPNVPHDHGYFAYTPEEMLGFGHAAGFQSTYIGGWNHPRGQVMVAYRKPAG